MSSNSSDEVWLIIDSLTFGGIETHILELAKGLKRFRLPIRVLFLRTYTKEPLLKHKLDSEQISVQFLDTGGKNYLANLVSLIRQKKPALLHSHGYKASLLCKLAHSMIGVRQITTYHAGETPKGKVWVYDFIDRWTSFISNHSIAVSDKIANKLSSKSVCFNNFIDTQGLNVSKGNQVAFVGRLSHEKGPDRFVSLAQRHRDVTFHIYGSGDLEPELKAISTKNLVFHGHQNDMQEIWPLIGALVICSRFEGLPMTAIEAMARGIPVFSLNVGNMSKLIQHSVNGYLFDSMDAMSSELNEFLNLDARHKADIQQHAINTIQAQYSQFAVIPQMLELYFPSRQSDCQIEK